MAKNGIFDIVTPQDWFQKLQYDHRRVLAAPGDRYAAVDFLIAASHLRDWVATTGRRNIARCTLLSACNELANNSKHRISKVRESKRHGSNRVVKDTKVIGGAFQFPGFDPAGFDVGHLVIELTGDAEKEFGQEIGIEVLADKVLDFWADVLNFSSS